MLPLTLAPPSCWSGCLDSNQGLPPSKGGTLARLSYTQICLSRPFVLRSAFRHGCLCSAPLGGAGIRPLQAPSREHPGSPGAGGRSRTCGRSFWRRRHPSGLTHACLGSPARLRTWSGRINSPAPVPTGTPRNKKTPLFRAGLHEDSTVVSCYSMESLHAAFSSLDRTSSHESWRTSATGDRVPAGRGVMRYVAVCFITGPRKIGSLI